MCVSGYDAKGDQISSLCRRLADLQRLEKSPGVRDYVIGRHYQQQIVCLTTITGSRMYCRQRGRRRRAAALGFEDNIGLDVDGPELFGHQETMRVVTDNNWPQPDIPGTTRSQHQTLQIR
jgi:hypothetical protein